MISVIIPTRNAEDYLVSTLSALVPGVVDGLIKEVIIVDAGSKDSTLEIAESTGCTIIRGDKNRGLQLWQGCQHARGDWFLILHADSKLGEGWIDQLRFHMKEYALRAGYFRLKFDDASWFATFWAEVVAFRSRWLGMPSGDHGLFLSRALYESVGGYRDQFAFEDLALVMALGRTRLRPISVSLMTNADRFRDKNWLLNQITKSMTFIGYLLGFPPKPPVAR